MLLSFGATPYEAAWPTYTATFRQAMIPAINGMNVIGLVSIPVMMTGQILGGSSPKTAADYQIVITVLFSGCQCMAVLSISFFPSLRCSRRERLILERFHKNLVHHWQFVQR